MTSRIPRPGVLLPAAATCIGLALAIMGTVQILLAAATATRVRAALAGADGHVAQDAPISVLAAQARFAIAHGDMEAAQAIADGMTAPAAAATRETLLYTLGNARMRRAYGMFSQVPFRLVKPVIELARADYRQALRIDPGDWDARYNYALAASLVRDTQASTPSVGTEMSHERAAWPDIPGAPNGLP